MTGCERAARYYDLCKLHGERKRVTGEIGRPEPCAEYFWSADGTDRRCTKCHIRKDLSEFSPKKLGKFGRCSVCKQCQNKHRRAQWKQLPDARRAALLAASNCHRRAHPERRMFLEARNRAKKRGLKFNIEQTDILIPDHCPVLGIRLNRHGGKPRREDSPSLERIDTARGYEKGNVEVISWRANRLKNDATLDELQRIVNWLLAKGV